MALTIEQGTLLVRFARSVIEASFSGKNVSEPADISELLAQKRGVFVTLETYPSKELRGCIGYPEPVMELGDAVRDAAKSSAFRDPRFSHVSEDELPNLIVEVSVLTVPELIKVENPKEYVQKVEVGRDGLIAEAGFFRGLLLPQVPVDWKWDAEEFLSQTCRKAGLPSDYWLDPKIKIYRFGAQVFQEVSPSGNVVEKKLTTDKK